MSEMAMQIGNIYSDSADETRPHNWYAWCNLNWLNGVQHSLKKVVSCFAGQEKPYFMEPERLLLGS
jgi:hypothetical protein